MLQMEVCLRLASHHFWACPESTDIHTKALKKSLVWPITISPEQGETQGLPLNLRTLISNAASNANDLLRCHSKKFSRSFWPFCFTNQLSYLCWGITKLIQNRMIGQTSWVKEKRVGFAACPRLTATPGSQVLPHSC